MRLQDLFETKQTIADAISRCEPYLSMPGAMSGLLWRGIDPKVATFQNEETGLGIFNWAIVKRRTDRRPISTSPIFSKVMDDVFAEQFGWKPRSTGVFVTGSRATAGGYGVDYACVPIGKTRFIWSPNVEDLYITCDGFERYQQQQLGFGSFASDVPIQVRHEIAERFKEHLRDLNYTDTSLEDAIRSRNEIMLDCDSYLLLYHENRSLINKLLGFK